MKKRWISFLLVAMLSLSALTGCHNSSQKTSTKDVKETGYDPKEEVKKFKMGKLNNIEKDRTVEMGYYNCDHMVGSII
ncbi:MAG: hypothetical protein RR705_10760, partial [Lachnospiraceae bacterium]